MLVLGERVLTQNTGFSLLHYSLSLCVKYGVYVNARRRVYACVHKAEKVRKCVCLCVCGCVCTLERVHELPYLIAQAFPKRKWCEVKGRLSQCGYSWTGPPWTNQGSNVHRQSLSSGTQTHSHSKGSKKRRGTQRKGKGNKGRENGEGQGKPSVWQHPLSPNSAGVTGCH